MATVTCVFTVDYVAQILDEHPDLIQAVICNDDNLSYGAIVAVRTGPEGGVDALTSEGISELAGILRNARTTPESWVDFLEDFVGDPETIETVTSLNLR